jgi:hypothetical protein
MAWIIVVAAVCAAPHKRRDDVAQPGLPVLPRLPIQAPG